MKIAVLTFVLVEKIHQKLLFSIVIMMTDWISSSFIWSVWIIPVMLLDLISIWARLMWFVIRWLSMISWYFWKSISCSIPAYLVPFLPPQWLWFYHYFIGNFVGNFENGIFLMVLKCRWNDRVCRNGLDENGEKLHIILVRFSNCKNRKYSSFIY